MFVFPIAPVPFQNSQTPVLQAFVATCNEITLTLNPKNSWTKINPKKKRNPTVNISSDERYSDPLSKKRKPPRYISCGILSISKYRYMK